MRRGPCSDFRTSSRFLPPPADNRQVDEAICSGAVSETVPTRSPSVSKNRSGRMCIGAPPARPGCKAALEKRLSYKGRLQRLRGAPQVVRIRDPWNRGRLSSDCRSVRRPRDRANFSRGVYPRSQGGGELIAAIQSQRSREGADYLGEQLRCNALVAFQTVISEIRGVRCS